MSIFRPSPYSLLMLALFVPKGFAQGGQPSDSLGGRYALMMTIRDFSQAHPDFDFGDPGQHPVNGVVQPVLGPDPGRKPVLDSANASMDSEISFSHFDWWVTDSTRPDPLKNYESCYDLPMSKGIDGRWEYDSYRDSPYHGFWPVEGTLNRFNDTATSCYWQPLEDGGTWVSGPPRNGNFCAESHASFVYSPGQTFSVEGDDDVWAFIDGKLAVDLGGVHMPMFDSVDLDTLGLTAGKTYKWDFFYCERQPCGSSLHIKTPIRFRQARALYGKSMPGPTPGSVSVELWKGIGATGSCGSAGSDQTDSVKAAKLKYQLIDSSGAIVKDLSNPGIFFGGITIAEPVITVDAAKIPLGALAPGATFRVIAFDPANPSLRVEVPFRIPSASEGLQRPRKRPNLFRSGNQARNLMGRRVPKIP